MACNKLWLCQATEEEGRGWGGGVVVVVVFWFNKAVAELIVPPSHSLTEVQEGVQLSPIDVLRSPQSALCPVVDNVRGPDNGNTLIDVSQYFTIHCHQSSAMYWRLVYRGLAGVVAGSPFVSADV